LSSTHPTVLFPQLKTKLKGCHFDTTAVIKAESQVLLNTLTECNFQDALKKWLKCWEWCIHTEGGYFEGDGGRQAQIRWQHQSKKLRFNGQSREAQ
jgi:hypothetical protein